MAEDHLGPSFGGDCPQAGRYSRAAWLGGSPHPPGDWAAWRFCNLYGTPNIFGQGKNCGEAEFLVECAMYGKDTTGSSPVPGITQCLLLWGRNPVESGHVLLGTMISRLSPSARPPTGRWPWGC